MQSFYPVLKDFPGVRANFAGVFPSCFFSITQDFPYALPRSHDGHMGSARLPTFIPVNCVPRTSQPPPTTSRLAYSSGNEGEKRSLVCQIPAHGLCRRIGGAGGFPQKK